MAESFNRPPSERGSEFDTSPRHSLAYDLIGNRDIFVAHPTGKVRIITYEAPEAGRIELRETLLRKGLILGRLLTDEEDDEQVFRVPESARPIAYDARVQSPGAYSYNDEQLFYDLGGLLGGLYAATEDKLVTLGDIGHSVALVEFIKRDERQLYFVPGIEKITSSLPEEISPVGYYGERLRDAFGSRFDSAGLSFRMGFAEVMGEVE